MKKKFTGFYVPKGGLEPPLGLSQTGFWVQRVYQFRHFGIFFNRIWRSVWTLQTFSCPQSNQRLFTSVLKITPIKFRTHLNVMKFFLWGNIWIAQLHNSLQFKQPVFLSIYSQYLICIFWHFHQTIEILKTSGRMVISRFQIHWNF